MVMVVLVVMSGLAGRVGPVLAPSAVSAETPTEVIEDLEANVYIGRTREADVAAEDFADAIAAAAQDGHRLLIIAPNESVPSGEAFALRVRQADDADITISFTETGEIEASVIDELTDRENQALDAAREAATPKEAADAYVETLLTVPEREVPETINQVVRAVIYLTLALGVVVLLELIIRGFRKQRHKRRRRKAQATAALAEPDRSDHEVESAPRQSTLR